MMKCESRCLLARPHGSQRSFRNILEHSAASWWESQICQRSCQLYPDFQLLLGPQCHINTALPSLHLSPSPSLLPSFPPSRPLALLPSFHTGTIARTMPGCHHIKGQRERDIQRDTERERERERGRERERHRITVRVEIWLCIKAKLRGKNFLLNWLYIHEKRNHNVSLPGCVARSPCVFVCLLEPLVYTLPVSTFTHCYQSHFCGRRNPHFHMVLHSSVFGGVFLSTLRTPTTRCLQMGDSQILHCAIRRVKSPSTRLDLLST